MAPAAEAEATKVEAKLSLLLASAWNANPAATLPTTRRTAAGIPHRKQQLGPRLVPFSCWGGGEAFPIRPGRGVIKTALPRPGALARTMDAHWKLGGSSAMAVRAPVPRALAAPA